MSFNNRGLLAMFRRSLGIVGCVQSTKVKVKVPIKSISTVSEVRSIFCKTKTMYRNTYAASSSFVEPAQNLVGGQNNSAKMSNSTSDKSQEIIFRQLLDYKSYTYTYVLADPDSREAVLIDPVYEMVERDINVVRDLGLDLKFAVNTHVHADHVTGSGKIKKHLPNCRSVIAAVSGATADVHVNEGSTIPFGPFHLECYSTPGHTNGCMTYVLRPHCMVFTGDAVLIRGCGRTDFQQGDAGKLYDSVHAKIFSLPRHFKVFPAHDYTGQTSSTVDEELKFNRRLTRSRNEFIEIMNKLDLPYPKQIDKALPANLVCGVYDVDEQQQS